MKKKNSIEGTFDGENEKKFSDLLFTNNSYTITITDDIFKKISSFLKIYFSTITKADDRIFLIGNKKLRPGKKVNLFFIATLFIRQTQTLLLFFSKEINIKIVLKRNELLIGLLKVFYASLYFESMHNEFADSLVETFYESTLINFKPAVILKHLEEEELNGALASGSSIKGLESSLNFMILLYEKTFRFFGFISVNEHASAVSNLKKHHKNIINRYILLTEPSNLFQAVRITYILIFILVIALNLLSPGTLFSITCMTASLYYLPPFLYRKMNVATQRSLSSQLQNTIDSIKLRSNDQNILSSASIIKNASLEENAIASAKLQVLLTTLNLRFVQYKPQKKLPNVRTCKNNKLQEDTTRPVYLLSDCMEASSVYNTINLRKNYPFPNKKKNIAPPADGKSASVLDSDRSAGPSYSFKLQSSSGIQTGKTRTKAGQSDLSITKEEQLYKSLVCSKKDKSRIVLNWALVEKSVPDDIKKKLRSNAYFFGAKKGDFGVVKFIGSDRCRVKEFDGLRIDSSKQGDYNLPDSTSCPLYEAYSVTYK